MGDVTGNLWIAVDLDGTLAYYDGWRGEDHIGPPIDLMVARVKFWLSRGIDVRIFTSRANKPEYVPLVKAWCKEHIGRELPVTCVKDLFCYEIWSDKCVQVVTNTGQRAVCK